MLTLAFTPITWPDCLNDLLFRVQTGSMPIQVPLIISNHPDYRALAEAHKIPFYHLPINTAEGKTKEWQEGEIMKLVKEYDIELVVLARYMQVSIEAPVDALASNCAPGRRC